MVMNFHLCHLHLELTHCLSHRDSNTPASSLGLPIHQGQDREQGPSHFKH